LSRGIFRVTATAVVTVAAGVTAGSAPAVGQQAISLQLGYACAFPSGSRPVSAQVTATFPAAGTVGQPIKPTGTRIAVTLPSAAVADLTRLNAARVTLTAELTTHLTEGTRAGTAIWHHFTSPATAIPRGGPLTLTASGTVPTITAPVAGEVTVTAAGLSLLFTVRLAGNPSASPSPSVSPSPSASPSPSTSPSSTQVACVLRSGQGATLARVAVAGPAGARAPVSPADNPAMCRPFPKGLKLNPRFPLPKPPPGIKGSRSVQKGCAYATGLTNLRKLHEAALVGPGLTDLKLGVRVYVGFPPATPYTYFQQDVAGQLQYHGRPELPPAQATLLGFGFTPVTATQQITEIGPVNATLISCVPGPQACPNHPTNYALFFARVKLRIYNVKVDGVPLNVGPHCQTTPFNLKLEGVPPSYSVQTIQGVLTGTATVPAFTGCGVDENLDPIFNASVSGPGNSVKILQAVPCTPATASGCPTAKPIGAARLLLKDTTTGKALACSSFIGGTFQPGSGQANPIGSITTAAISCVPQLGLNFTVSTSAQPTSPWPMNAVTHSNGVIHGTISNISAIFNIPPGQSKGCQATLAGTSATTPGSVNFTYANGTQVLKVSGGNLHYWSVTGCKGVIRSGDPVELTATYLTLPAPP
jgi:hypothetical protein